MSNDKGADKSIVIERNSRVFFWGLCFCVETTGINISKQKYFVSTILPDHIDETGFPILGFIPIPCLKFRALYKLSISILYSNLSPFGTKSRRPSITMNYVRPNHLCLKYCTCSSILLYIAAVTPFKERHLQVLRPSKYPT